MNTREFNIKYKDSIVTVKNTEGDVYDTQGDNPAWTNHKGEACLSVMFRASSILLNNLTIIKVRPQCKL